MPNIYIIAGCNGAGKTTASFTVLPEILNCREFVNADNIAAGLSPFNVESVAIASGRLMLLRMDELMNNGVDFAIETTLSTRTYVSFIKKAQLLGYKVTLLYFWLSSPQNAIIRVAKRVKHGGHHISDEVIKRRYFRGIYNLIHLYIPLYDSWSVFDNTQSTSKFIARGLHKLENKIFNFHIWNTILKCSYDSK